MKNFAVIAAGGSGTRMGNSTPKQFLLLQGKPLIWHSVKIFHDTFPGITIIVVVPSGEMASAREICREFENVIYTEGGSSRFQSVKNGLALVNAEGIVFVHDAVRCLVTPDLLKRCLQQAEKTGSAVPSVALNDSVRLVEDGKHRVINRNSVRIIQTPQTFQSGILLPAFSMDESEVFTDEATVVEASGMAVTLVEGEYTNIKITRPLDLIVAEKVLSERSSLQ